jgi:hypothetical protein
VFKCQRSGEERTSIRCSRDFDPTDLFQSLAFLLEHLALGALKKWSECSIFVTLMTQTSPLLDNIMKGIKWNYGMPASEPINIPYRNRFDQVRGGGSSIRSAVGLLMEKVEVSARPRPFDAGVGLRSCESSCSLTLLAIKSKNGSTFPLLLNLE